MGGSSSKQTSHSGETVLVATNPQTIIVCGGGVMGISSSWYLALRGHKVICLERRKSADDGTDYCSYRNGALICPSLAIPWVSPATGVKAAKSLLLSDKNSTLVLDKSVILQTDFWKFCYNAGKSTVKSLTGAETPGYKSLYALGAYSLQKFEPLLSQADIGQSARGTLQVCNSNASLNLVHKQLGLLQSVGCDIQQLDGDGCRKVAPMVNGTTVLGGALGVRDTSGDIFLFCKFLKAKCEKIGVKFQYGCEIDTFVTEGSRVVAVKTTDGREIKGDSFVLATGVRTRQIAAKLGVHVPIMPVKGYAIQVPLAPSSLPLPCNIVDDANKLYIAPLNRNISISGRAEFGVDDLTVNEDVAKAMLARTESLFVPGYLEAEKADFHVCLRPMTPDDHPVIGKLKNFDNLYVNAGHGSKGWSQSVGSSDLLAHIIDGATPPIDVAPFRPDRF